MALKGYQVIIFEWCMIIYTLFLVYLRLHTRFSRSSTSRPINRTSDLFVFLSWLAFAFHGAYSIALWKTGYMEWHVDPHSPDIPPEYQRLALKIFFMNDLCYYNCVYAAKFSMLSLYLEFFPRYMKWTRRTVVATHVLAIAGFLTQFLMVMFWCLPINRNWALNESFCTAATSSIQIWVASGPHFFTDILIYALPFPVLYRLGLPLRQKIGLGLSFAAGFLCIFFGALVLASIWFSGRTPVIWMFAVLEQMNAVVVICTPAVKSWAVDGKRMNILPWKWGKKNDNETDAEKTRDPEVGVLVVEMRSDMQRHVSAHRKSSHKAGRESLGMVSTLSECKSLS